MTIMIRWLEAVARAAVALPILCLAIVWHETALAACTIPSFHAGVSFRLANIDQRRSCALLPIIEQYTTANKIGPMRTPLPEPLYQYLLDHPVIAAALVNRLDFGLHKASMLGPDRFWGTDGEGTEGVIELVHRDADSRVYYVDGRHDGTFLPQVTGKAVVFLRTRPLKEADGQDSIETTFIAYTRLDNRLLSGLLSLVRPLAGKVITRQVLKGFEAVHRLGDAMHLDPGRVLFEATDPPPLPEEDIAFLKSALVRLQNPTQEAHPAAAPR
jgi:hypothetical protein